MRTSRSLIAILASLLTALSAPTAGAESVHVSDPVGNGQDGRNFDITSFSVTSSDFKVATHISFRQIVWPADLYVFYSIRGGHGHVGAIVHSRLRRSGAVTTMRDQQAAIKCARLSADWHLRTTGVHLSFPSRCLAHGNYGAFHVQMIVERGVGSDADFAPKDTEGNGRWTRWIARG